MPVAQSERSTYTNHQLPQLPTKTHFRHLLLQDFPLARQQGLLVRSDMKSNPTLGYFAFQKKFFRAATPKLIPCTRVAPFHSQIDFTHLPGRLLVVFCRWSHVRCRTLTRSTQFLCATRKMRDCDTAWLLVGTCSAPNVMSPNCHRRFNKCMPPRSVRNVDIRHQTWAHLCGYRNKKILSPLLQPYWRQNRCKCPFISRINAIDSWEEKKFRRSRCRTRWRQKTNTV